MLKFTKLNSVFFKEQPCKLAVDSISNVVAYGKICSETATKGTVWGIKLGDEVVRLHVDMCVDEKAISPMRMGKHELTVKEVVGNQVPWPKNMVTIEKSKVITQLILTCCSFFFKLWSLEYPIRVSFQVVTPVRRSPRKKTKQIWSLEYLKTNVAKVMGNDNSISFPLDENIFGKDRVLYILRDDIMAFCSMEWITSSCIVLYMR